jgi:CarD family transcriptional regulator
LQVGEAVVYPHHGVARVASRERRRFFDAEREYLVLETVVGDLTVLVPVEDAERVGLRRVVSRAEAEDVFAVLGRRDVHMPANWARRLKNHAAKLETGDIYELAEVVRNLSIHARTRQLATAEANMFKGARRRLVSELSLALGLGEAPVGERIDEVLR